mmetsp:Transcript_121869/g.171486  ORF Transcript_121869/g.171486 Transcript_121869/m.171486 type:complete len:225 (+) Transcript_121869:228-902(+)
MRCLVASTILVQADSGGVHCDSHGLLHCNGLWRSPESCGVIDAKCSGPDTMAKNARVLVGSGGSRNGRSDSFASAPGHGHGPYPLASGSRSTELGCCGLGRADLHDFTLLSGQLLLGVQAEQSRARPEPVLRTCYRSPLRRRRTCLGTHIRWSDSKSGHSAGPALHQPRFDRDVRHRLRRGRAAWGLHRRTPFCYPEGRFRGLLLRHRRVHRNVRAAIVSPTPR